MAVYTQTRQSVSTTYFDFLSSQVDYGNEWVVFADADYYYLVEGELDSTDNVISGVDTTVYKLSRDYTHSNTLDVSRETSTTIKIVYPYYSYSNIGVGTVKVTASENYVNSQIPLYASVILTVTMLLTLGFNLIKKRWLRG